jgi:DNA polymerase III epsilon subunit-like protein
MELQNGIEKLLEFVRNIFKYNIILILYMTEKSIKKILVFDTETTGFPPARYLLSNYHRFRLDPDCEGSYNETNEQYDERISVERARKLETGILPIETNIDTWRTKMAPKWPRLVQLSYVCYDIETKDTKSVDSYIELPAEYTSESYLSNVFWMVRDNIVAGLASDTRLAINDAIDGFMRDFREADIVVGHNIVFDINMLLAECILSEKVDAFNELISSVTANKLYCTASEITDVLKMYEPRNAGKGIYKTAALNQTYFSIFGYPPTEEKLHNSLNDVIVTLRVFWRMWFSGIHFNNTNHDIPICGVGQPDIYLDLIDSDPSNQIIALINNITADGIDPAGIGEPIHLCPEISEADLKIAMKNATAIKSTGGKRHSRKNKKSKCKKSKRRKSKRRKSKRRN